MQPARARPAPPSGSAFTWKEFAALDKDDRHELVHGRLVEAEAPTPWHSWIIGMLFSLLNDWALPRRIGYALGDGVKLRIDDTHGRIPDAIFVRHGNPLRMEKEGIVAGVPNVVIEVVSASPDDQRRDRIEKLNEYARLGVPEYWLIDADARSFERLVLENGAYSIRAALQNDDVFRAPEYEGLEIPLEKLWNFPLGS